MFKRELQKNISRLLTMAMVAGMLPTATFATSTGEESIDTDIALLNEVSTVDTETTEVIPAYLDTSYTFEERAVDLVSRMTDEERQTQLSARLGTANAIDRLGIRYYNYCSEANHGIGRNGSSTFFPTGLSMSSTWDTELVERMNSAVSDEGREKFNDWSSTSQQGLSYFSPTINLLKDPRWGRADESYGEDPFQTGAISTAFINGLQGTDDVGNDGDFVTADSTSADGYLKAIATAKHYAANSSESNRRYDSSNVTESDLREYYTKAFMMSVQDANMQSVMTAYNGIQLTDHDGNKIDDSDISRYEDTKYSPLYQGIPMSTNEYLVDEMLRRTWGFDGYVVTDCGAIGDILNKHEWRPASYEGTWSAAAATAYAILAGTDSNCGSSTSSYYNLYALDAVEAGYMEMGDIDVAVVRMFTQRMMTGEFDGEDCIYNVMESDDPDAVTYNTGDQIGTVEHIALAEETAVSTPILLKNEPATENDTEALLPLNAEEIKNLVVIGDNADSVISTSYSTSTITNDTTPLEGLDNLFDEMGVDVNVTWVGDPAVATDSSTYKYMMNIGDTITVKDADGNIVNTISIYNDNNGYAECSVSSSGTGSALGTSGTTYVSFGTLNLENADTFEFTASGQSNTSPTTVELRWQDPDTGSLMTAPVELPGNTGSWTTYETYTMSLDEAMEGEDLSAIEDVYLVFYRTVDETADAEFSDDEVAAIKAADAVIYYAGTTNDDGSEGDDRTTLALPRSQSDIINAVVGLNANTVVYMQAMGQMDVEEFIDNIPAFVWVSYNGQAQGNAMARIIFGETNPSGRLAFTWYTDIAQLNDNEDYTMRSTYNEETESYDNYGRTYQYFEGDVTYPFGYGLSYTSFDYLDDTLTVTSTGGDAKNVTPDDSLTITFDVTNTGAVEGKEVAQIYIVSPNADSEERPNIQLQGFEKQTIAAGDTATYTIQIDAWDLWFWDEENDMQTYDQGEYTLLVGTDCESAEMAYTFELTGQLTPEVTVVTATPDGHFLYMSEGNVITTELSVARNDQSFAVYDNAVLDGANVAIRYTSNDESVATVTDDGVVTGVATGLTTITAYVSEDGGEEVSHSYAVKVMDEFSVTDLALDGTTVEGFDDDTYDYTYYVDDMDSLPALTAVYSDNITDAVITQATATNATTTLTFTFDGLSYTYTITFLLPPTSMDFTTATEEDVRDIFTVLYENADGWAMTDDGLNILADDGDIYEGATSTHSNMFMQENEGDWVIQVQLNIADMFIDTGRRQQAMIMVYSDDDNYIKLDIEYQKSPTKDWVADFGWEDNQDFTYTEYTAIESTEDAVWVIRMVKTGDTYDGYYSADEGATFTKLGSTITMDLDDSYVGFLATNGDQDNAKVLDVTIPYFSYLNTVTVDGGTAIGDTADDDLFCGALPVELVATPAAGQTFLYWEADTEDVVFDDATAAETTFVMPSRPVNITAVYDGESTVDPEPDEPDEPDEPTMVTKTLTYDLADMTTEAFYAAGWSVQKESDNANNGVDSTGDWWLDETGLNIKILEGQEWKANNSASNIFVVEPPAEDWTADVEISWTDLTTKNEKVGIYHYLDENYYMGLAYELQTTPSTTQFQRITEIASGTAFTSDTAASIADNSAIFRIVRDGDNYTTYYSSDDGATYNVVYSTSASTTSIATNNLETLVQTGLDEALFAIMTGVGDGTNTATVASVTFTYEVEAEDEPEDEPEEETGAPVGTIDLEATADLANDLSTFTVMLSDADFVKAVAFAIEGVEATADTVTAAEGFDITIADDGMCILAYAQGSTDTLTSADAVAIATITVEGGAEISITDVKVVNNVAYVGEQDATVLNDTASTVEIFALLALYDLNGDKRVDYSDIVCITPSYGHPISDETAKYDLDNSGSIDSADYLMVYEYMTNQG